MVFGVLWMCVIFGVLSICKAKSHQNHTGSQLKFDDNLQLSWRINSTKETIRFTVKATIDKTGWFLVGFSLPKNQTKVSLKDITGDAFVVWKGKKQNEKKPVWRISECNIVKGSLQKDKDHSAHYHLGRASYNPKAKLLTVLVWRPLKTKNVKDVEIKPGPLLVYGSYGNDDGSTTLKWKKKMKLLNDGAVDDAFKATENVDFFKKAPTSENGKSNSKTGPVASAAKIAEKHWIGIVVGVSAFLTVLITCSVYCLTKKKNNEFKRVVSMPFHKNTDYEDEAKVAFLQSEET
ncbi:hypothetical protein QZH41_019753 [Actinostola sp. cb2023]|nr:hypothetical protein QZH41_019753 [Actinostola sp. cb2023]